MTSRASGQTWLLLLLGVALFAMVSGSHAEPSLCADAPEAWGGMVVSAIVGSLLGWMAARPHRMRHPEHVTGCAECMHGRLSE